MDPVDAPEQQRWRGALATAAIAAVLVLPYVWTSYFPEDEFTTLSNGLRMLRGELIYRDFFEFTAPLSHALAGLVFWIAGPSLLVARVTQALLLVLASWQLHRLARALGAGPIAATLPGLILVLALYRTLPGFNHHWVALPLMLGALQAGMRGLDTGRARWWGLAGLAAGATALAMQSDGPVLLAVIFGAAGLQAVLGATPWRRVVRHGAAILAGFAGPLAVAAGFFWAQGGLAAAWHHVWEWPLSQYKSAGGANDVAVAMDVPALLSTGVGWVNTPFWYGKAYHVLFLYGLVAIAAAGALAWGLGLLWRRVAGGGAWRPLEARYGLAALAVLGFTALMVRGRADLAHVAEYAVPAVLVGVAAADGLRRKLTDPGWAVARHLPLAAFAAFALTGGMWLAQTMRAAPADWLSLTPPDARLQARPAIRYLRDQARPGDRMIGAPYAGLYYFYGPPPAGRYTLMLPPHRGYYSEAEYRAFWDEILAEQPRFVVFAPWAGEAELAEYLDRPLPGYRKAATPLIREGGVPATVFERID